MQLYNVTLTGVTDMIHHWDNIEWADEMKAWREEPDNKAKSKAGDDRSPAWTWIGAMYHDGEHVAVPQDNLMRCLMEAGAMVLVPGGKNGKTFKSQTQSGLMVTDPFWPLKVSGRLIPIEPVLHLATEADFGAHLTAVRGLGFDLLVKRAKVGQSKHVRVRPIFSQWTISGSVAVLDEAITDKVLADIFERGGTYKGLCDWRPGGKTPGPFGRFTAEITRA